MFFLEVVRLVSSGVVRPWPLRSLLVACCGASQSAMCGRILPAGFQVRWAGGEQEGQEKPGGAAGEDLRCLYEPVALGYGQGQGYAADFAVDDEWDRYAYFSVGVLQNVELGGERAMVVQVLEERGPVGDGALGERDGPVS
ncbi:hypothetical protein [Streptomyces virginiae]